MLTTSEKHTLKRTYKRLQKTVVGPLRTRVARFLFQTLPSLQNSCPCYRALRISQEHTSLTKLQPLP